MHSIPEILTLIKSVGFKEVKKIDLMMIGYEYNYLYFFKKTSV